MAYINPELEEKFVDSMNKKQGKKRSKKLVKQTDNKSSKVSYGKFFIVGTVFLIIIAVVLTGPISDSLTISHADPTILKLAQDSGMSRKGELIFLRTHPQLVTGDVLSESCPNSKDGFILYGCFVPSSSDPTTGQIYLRQMSSDLYPLEVSTAAYEMLHPVYNSLTQDQSTQSNLNKSIESNFTAINDPTINNNVNEFAKTEPGARDDELFSLLATLKYDELDQQLQSYLQPYFDNPQNATDDNNQIASLFQQDENQLTQLNSTIEADNKQANTAYYDSVSWANAGNQYEDNYNYNIYVQDLNSENAAIDQYNSLLDSYNTLINEYNGKSFNPIQNQQSQSAQ